MAIMRNLIDFGVCFKKHYLIVSETYSSRVLVISSTPDGNDM